MTNSACKSGARCLTKGRLKTRFTGFQTALLYDGVTVFPHPALSRVC
nr:MAG TPA: hypothetical protein [Caudoviricetes sp.]